MSDIELWEDDLLRRYQAVGNSPATTDADGRDHPFRDYRAEARPEVKQFYRQHHAAQTLEFVRGKRAEYLPPRRRQLGLWEALELLDRLVDDSDPDTALTQIEHSLQTAEAIRVDGHPRWFVLTGLIHDLGKVLCLFGEPQWAVVGDTFPVGCAPADSIVFPEFLAENPDGRDASLQTACGIYAPGCGLDNVLLTWGHDEYLYHVVRDYLPAPALAMIRYHSFYPWHRDGAYAHLMNDADAEKLRWVRAFNPYDLYSKTDTRPDVATLRPFYEELVAEFFPEKLWW